MSIDVRSAVPKGGFLASWLDYVEPFEYPESYSLFAMLACAACAIDGRVLVNPGSKPETYTNIYTLLYGPSGTRKSDALLDAVDLLADAVPEAPILPENFSSEALIHRLAQDSKDPDEENPHRRSRGTGMIVAEEISTLIGGKDYRLENSKDLSKLWDSRAVATFLTIARGEQVVKNAYVTLAACSAPEWTELMDPRALTGGFWRRIMLVCEYKKRKDSSHPIPNTVLRNRLADIFRGRVGPAAFRGTLMRLNPGALELNDDWYSHRLKELVSKACSQREEHFVNTLQAHSYKIAALVHLLEGGDPEWLNEDSLAVGFNLLEKLLPGTFQVYSSLVPTPFARLKSTAMRAAQSFGRKFSMAELDRAVSEEAGVHPNQAAEARKALCFAERLEINDTTGLMKVIE